MSLDNITHNPLVKTAAVTAGSASVGALVAYALFTQVKELASLKESEKTVLAVLTALSVMLLAFVLCLGVLVVRNCVKINEQDVSTILIAANEQDVSRALHDAAKYGHKEVVKRLLDNGADIEAKDNNGWTALHLAAWRGHKEVVKLLLEKGANKEVKNKCVWTALHIAARDGELEVVKLLLDNGADIEAKDNDGWTALHLAARNGMLEVVKLLLDNGADPTSENDDKQKPSGLVITSGPVQNLLLAAEKEWTEFQLKIKEAGNLVATFRTLSVPMMSGNFDEKLRPIIMMEVLEIAKSLETPHLSKVERNNVINFFTSGNGHLKQLGLTKNPTNDPQIKEKNNQAMGSVLKKLIRGENPESKINNPGLPRVSNSMRQG